MEKEDTEETNDPTGTALEIKEYSEVSSDENDATNDEDNVGESKESGTQNELSESIEEAPENSKSRSKVDEEYDRDIAQQKKNRRARAQPGAKRGGRRDTGRSGWGRRFLGKNKPQFQAGDLVEAEWAGSGWWYVGYVGGGAEPNGAAEVKSGKRKKDVFHIIFIDGDEADVPGRDLNLLGTTGQPAGNCDTALPRHVPVADLGPGRLHGNRNLPSDQRENAGGERKGKGHQSKKDRRNKKKNNIDSDDNDNDIHQEPGISPLPRRVSVGNIKDRVRRGENAVWGGRGALDGGIRGGGDWWDTGTAYAFQPRLAADKTTVLSFVGTGGRRGRDLDLDQRGGSRGNSGGDDEDSRVDSRTDSVASGLSLQHQQQQLLQRGRGASRELVRIVKVPEDNEHHGQRVFFLA